MLLGDGEKVAKEVERGEREREVGGREDGFGDIGRSDQAEFIS